MNNYAKTINKQIQTYQNSFIRRSLGLTPATPLPLIYALANELLPSERATWLTAKELINNIATDQTLKEQLQNYTNFNSSYSLVLNQFRHVFEDLDIVDTVIPTTNLNVITNTLNDKKVESLN